MNWKSYSCELKLALVVLVWGGVLILLGHSAPLDARLYYGVTESTEFFKQLSSNEILAYKRGSLLDIGFIPLYTWFYFLLLRRFYPLKPYFKYLSFFALVADYVETVAIALILFGVLNEAPSWLGAATLFKWIFVGLNTLLILSAFIRQKLRRHCD